MIAAKRTLLLVALLLAGCLLVGCPGMPGGPGGADQQRTPPGVLPPPGMESGGARTLMGATVTAPDNAYLLVKFSTTHPGTPGADQWQTCRRISPLESCVLVEGINYDGRVRNGPQDVNQLIPYVSLASLEWRYEAKPAPPPQPQTQSRGRQSSRGR